jgi:hypothetical protein
LFDLEYPKAFYTMSNAGLSAAGRSAVGLSMMHSGRAITSRVSVTPFVSQNASAIVFEGTSFGIIKRQLDKEGKAGFKLLAQCHIQTQSSHYVLFKYRSSNVRPFVVDTKLHYAFGSAVAK